MKFGTLFELVSDAKDLLDLFEGVDNKDQMISRLEKLKRQAPDELLACTVGLHASVNAAMNESIDMSPSLDEDEITDEIDAEIKKLEDMSNAEDQNSASPDAVSEEKNTETPAG
jgi:hypothetical protein